MSKIKNNNPDLALISIPEGEEVGWGTMNHLSSFYGKHTEEENEMGEVRKTTFSRFNRMLFEQFGQPSDIGPYSTFFEVLPRTDHGLSTLELMLPTLGNPEPVKHYTLPKEEKFFTSEEFVRRAKELEQVEALPQKPREVQKLIPKLLIDDVEKAVQLLEAAIKNPTEINGKDVILAIQEKFTGPKWKAQKKNESDHVYQERILGSWLDWLQSVMTFFKITNVNGEFDPQKYSEFHTLFGKGQDILLTPNPMFGWEEPAEETEGEIYILEDVVDQIPEDLLNQVPEYILTPEEHLLEALASFRARAVKDRYRPFGDFRTPFKDLLPYDLGDNGGLITYSDGRKFYDGPSEFMTTTGPCEKERANHLIMDTVPRPFASIINSLMFKLLQGTEEIFDIPFTQKKKNIEVYYQNYFTYLVRRANSFWLQLGQLELNLEQAQVTEETQALQLLVTRLEMIRPAWDKLVQDILDSKEGKEDITEEFEEFLLAIKKAYQDTRPTLKMRGVEEHPILQWLNQTILDFNTDKLKVDTEKYNWVVNNTPISKAALVGVLLKEKIEELPKDQQELAWVICKPVYHIFKERVARSPLKITTETGKELNLNSEHLSITELKNLFGMTDSIAAAILHYRKNNYFSSLLDIKKVPIKDGCIPVSLLKLWGLKQQDRQLILPLLNAIQHSNQQDLTKNIGKIRNFKGSKEAIDVIWTTYQECKEKLKAA